MMARIYRAQRKRGRLLNAATIYPIALSVHVFCVMLSGALFAFRGALMLRASPMLHSRFLRIFPHVNDTILLIAAVTLAVIIEQYPFVHDWLTAKVLLLLVYIGLGSACLRAGGSRPLGVLFYLLAIATFLFMVSVAWYHHPLGLFSLKL